ncbi:Histone acetyltransferase KAT7 [Hypsizygus marmoreus]|uniref:Histone acetyltransferase n=1 Tax=Hypsizygus marmoreus TaxID=39966 RepID=A0A369JU41_HYPMA|nr:Histone acetyltransferase KAT7 [Hypsizygus marmoreus]
MRGLAFPSNADFDRETSYEYGTPVTQVDDIPIDPALSGPVIDPALMEEENNAVNHHVQSEPQRPQQDLPPPAQYTQIPQYSEGPQGDPFAPQQLPIFFPIQVEQPMPPSKPLKRKRRPPRESECSFCLGTDLKNKDGEPELMVTCDECGRSGHPSCMDLPGLGDIMRLYPWKCANCKSCEICHEKGDDSRILFCDFCDRGWHLYCLQPALLEPPQGKWHCPECPPLPSEEYMQMHPEMFSHPHEHNSLPPATPVFRDSSVASTSNSNAYATKSQTRLRGKGKGKATVVTTTDDSDSEETEVDIEGTPQVHKVKGRPKSNKRPKPRPSRAPQYSDDDPPPSSSPRQTKRARVQYSPAVPPLPRVRLRLPSQKGKGKEREEDDGPKGLFDDILSEKERDTSKTSITNADKQRFERSRSIAEQLALPPPIINRVSEAPDAPSTPGPSSRPLRSSTTYHISAFASATPIGPSASPAPSTATPAPFGKTDQLRIRSIRFGQFDIKTWYDAPFPEEYATIPDGRLWICEFCLKYMKSRFAVERHRLKCKARHPPGDEIYRDGAVSVFEVDGRKNKIYCQNLCLLSKMFLDHKSLFYDVEPFLFYVMTEMDEFGARFVGYFSKEKRSPKDYNVSCIMTLPVRQRQGWGNLLIDFSYLLSKKEQRAGSPEKPLSGLGALGYKNYWTLSLMRYLETAPDHPRLEDISAATSMTIEDIVTTLKQQGMIRARDSTPPLIRPSPGQSIKFPKGRKNGIARKHLQRTQTNDKETDPPNKPFVIPTHYDIEWDRDKVDSYLRNWEAKGYLTLKSEKLQWSPYLLTRKDKEEKEREEEKKRSHNNGGGKERSAVSEAASSAKPNEASGPSTSKESSTPDTLFPSPANIFDDELVEEVPTPAPATPKKQKSRSKSPADKAPPEAEQVPVESSLEDSPRKRTMRSRSNQALQPTTPKVKVIEEPRTTRGRWTRGVSNKANLRDDEALAAKLALEEQRQGRKLRSRASDTRIEKRPPSPVSPPKPSLSRKRPRVESSSEVEEEEEEEEEESPVTSAVPNGKHTSGLGVIRTEDVEIGPFNDDEISLVLPLVSSKVQDDQRVETNEKQNGIVDEDVKSEDLGTPLTSRQSVPSDDTVVTVGVVNGRGEGKESAEGDADADADGEYEEEEDAEGEPDEEV